MKRQDIFVFVFLVTFSSFFLFADGFWPEIQKNSYRTGKADVSGAVTDPEILWKYYRGGYINPSNAATDEEGGIYFSVNGVVKAVDADLNQLWESSNFGAGRIFKIIDIDKNGEKEIVVSGNSGIRMISTQSGTVLSTLSTGSPTFAKFSDINDDGFEEIIVRGGWNTKDVRAYDFSSGVSTPQMIWQITENIENYGLELVFGDSNDDGEKELITDRMSGGLISVFNALTGTLLHDKARVLDGQYAYGFNQIINLDADNQKEFVFSGRTSAEADRGSYSITVYDFVEDAVQWQYEYGWNTVSKGLQMIPGSISDFNGDGVIDVVVSVFNDTLEGATDKDGVNAAGIWTTLIYRADNGVLQARLDNTYLEGVADFDGNGVDEFILKDAPDSSKKLRAYSIISSYGFADGDFKKLWSRDKVKVVKAMPEDTEDVGVVYISDVPAKISVGTAEGIIVIEDINSDGVGDRIFSMSGADATAVLNDVAYLLDGKSFGFISATDSKIYFSGNDGFIHVFYRGATLGNEKKITTGNFTGDTVFVNSATGGKMLTSESTFLHVMLDSQSASLIKSPERTWSQINQYSQPLFAFDSNGDGLHEFISLYTDLNGYTDIYLHGSNGGLVWGWTVGKIITSPANFIAGDFDGDGFKDVAFTFTSEEEGAMLYALKGLDGSEIGNHDPQVDITGYYNNTTTLLDDINNDGSDDLFLGHSFASEIISGHEIERILKFTAYSWPNNAVSFDFTGDEIIDVFGNQRTGVKKDLFDLSGNVAWTVDTSWNENSLYQYSAPYPGISKIDTDEGFDIALGGKFGDVSAYSGTDGSVLWRICLSDGTSTDISVEMIPTSTLCGGTNLSNIVTGDIDGDSIDEFVAGDKLGNLYVINSEDGTIVWTMKFDGAIGNPILADVNSDGKIEIVTGAGDGYLYAIGQKLEVQSPAFVRDVSIDIDGEISGTSDIDEMITGSSYGGIWQAVTGAHKYQVRLTKSDETVLRETQVTGANQVIFSGLEVEIGDVLHLSVKTFDAGGYESEWKKSDGVTVTDEEAIPDDDVIQDNDAILDDDILIPDTDMDADSFEYDEDILEDGDVAADSDNIADIDLPEDTDPVVDADLIPDENVNDGIVADEDADIIDDDPETRSKDSGCGCSIL